MVIIFDKDIKFEVPYALLHLYRSSTRFSHRFHGPISSFYDGTHIEAKKTQALEKIMDSVEEVIRNPIKRTYTFQLRLVLNEENAQQLINFSEQNISNTTGYVHLNDILESGLMFFDRKILFQGWEAKNRSQLLQKLQSSGYHPQTHDSQGWYDATLSALRNQFRKSNIDFSQKYDQLNKEYEKKIADISTAKKIWRNSLKFVY